MTAHRTYLAERDAAVRKLHAEGVGDFRTAQALGVEVRCVQRIRNRLGLAPNHDGGPTAPRRPDKPNTRSTPPTFGPGQARRAVRYVAGRATDAGECRVAGDARVGRGGGTVTAVQLPPLEPGSDAWLRTMSASKIAAVVGLSPWHSRFSLWHQMAGLLPREPDNAVFRRGHYLEPAIAAWFADQHPTWRVGLGGGWARDDEPLFTASPDREAITDREAPLRVVGVEIKTENDVDDYGPDGSDEIPAHYRCQVQWQMYVRGTRVTHVAVLTKYLEFREYVVPYDEADAEYLADEARAFMASLPGGVAECRPDIDAHGATYTAVKRMHPSIDPRDVEIPQDVADLFLASDLAAKAIDREKRQATSNLLDLMGDARRATVGGVVVARRQPASRGGVALHPIHAPIPRPVEDAA